MVFCSYTGNILMQHLPSWTRVCRFMCANESRGGLASDKESSARKKTVSTWCLELRSWGNSWILLWYGLKLSLWNFPYNCKPADPKYNHIWCILLGALRVLSVLIQVGRIAHQQHYPPVKRVLVPPGHTLTAHQISCWKGELLLEFSGHSTDGQDSRHVSGGWGLLPPSQ